MSKQAPLEVLKNFFIAWLVKFLTANSVPLWHHCLAQPLRVEVIDKREDSRTELEQDYQQGSNDTTL